MSQKIYVCIKQVPDNETKFKLLDDNKNYDTSSIKWILNPYDEYAIEESIKIKSNNPNSQVIALTVGPKKRTVDALRTALALGADDAIMIHTEQEHLDHLTVAKALAAVIKQEGSPHVVLAGKLAIDDNAGMVPAMLATVLDLDHVSVATQAQWSESSVTITRELEGGTKEKIQANLPLVVSCNKGLNTPRFANLPSIMKAKKKIIKEVDLTSLGLDVTSYQLNQYQTPPEQPQARILQGSLDEQVETLVTLLRQEAKVL
jgi:electron transfer flavoprotein beta subunit